jgi:hypothetical protein
VNYEHGDAGAVLLRRNGQFAHATALTARVKHGQTEQFG